MQKVRNFIQEHRIVSITIAALFALALVGCCVLIILVGDGEEAAPEEPSPTVSEAIELSVEPTVTLLPTVPTEPAEPTDTQQATDALAPTDTPEPSDTPEPTDTATAPPPTNTPTSAPPTDTPQPTSIPPTETPEIAGPVLVGTHLVGTDIEPGIYVGSAGDSIMESCYWARLSDLSGEMDAVIANENALGHFYVEVLGTDRALETACRLLPIEGVPAPDEPLNQFGPGIYIVGRDIEPGTYRGTAGDSIMESCYWARLSCVQGTIGCVIANDNATGQFFVQVAPSDFALEVGCEMEKAE